MSTITIDTSGVLSVAYPGQPNGSHILQAPSGGKWTLLGNGTTGALTATDGATGTAETYVLYDTNNTPWIVSIDDTGVLTITSFDGTVVLAPAINAPIKINGVPASGYLLYAYQAGTVTAATIYKNGQTIAQQTSPVTLNAYGLPTDPIFIVVGIYYKFILRATAGGADLYTWDYVSAGIPANVSAPTEWISPSVTATYASASSFTVSGDQRTTFAPGRRVECVGSSTLYGTVTASTYGGTDTSITVALDSGSLDNSLTAVAYALLKSSGNALPSRRSVGASTVLNGNLTVPTASGINVYPCGMVALRTAAGSGWLACNGASLLRASYPNLFTAIGTTFGAADGTHFNVPTIAAVGSLNYYIYAQV